MLYRCVHRIVAISHCTEFPLITDFRSCLLHGYFGLCSINVHVGRHQKFCIISG